MSARQTILARALILTQSISETERTIQKLEEKYTARPEVPEDN